MTRIVLLQKKFLFQKSCFLRAAAFSEELLFYKILFKKYFLTATLSIYHFVCQQRLVSIIAKRFLFIS